MTAPRRALAAAVVLLACGGVPAGAEIPRDTVVMAKEIDDIVSLDPAEAYEASDSEVAGNLYDRLLDYDPAHGAAIVGALARSWSSDGDDRTFTFKIRAGVFFQSGDPVTAEDAAFSLRRAILLDKTPAFVLGQFGLTRENVRERIRALDPDTLVIETGKPVAPSFLYYCLTAIVGSVVDRRQVLAHERNGDLGHEWLATHSAGSGPYGLRIWLPAERYVLDANPGYWGGAPKNRRVVVMNIREAATQRLLFERGDVDYPRDLDKDQLAALAADPEIRFDRALQSGLVYLALNQKNPVMRRPEVIEALKLLVDYDGIARNILGDLGVVHQSFLPDGLLGAVDDRPYRFDPARARMLLERAGLGGGFGVSVDVRGQSPWIDIAQALQASFAGAGVRLTLVPSDGKQVLTKYRARRHELFLGEWGTDYPDPHSNAQAFVLNEDNGDGAATRTLAWRNSWQDAALGALVRQAAAEGDLARRAALYGELQRRWLAVAPFVVMFQEVAVVAHRRSVDGFVLGQGAGRARYAGIEKQ